MSNRTAERQLQIVGVGLNPWKDAAIEAIRAIHESKSVFCAAFHADFAKAHMSDGADLQLIREHLEYERPRYRSYQIAAQRVLETLKQKNPVTWVTSGDPTINCGITRELLNRCCGLGVCVSLFSGITAQLAVNALLPTEDRTDSFVQINAKDLFLSDVAIDPRFCLFVIQVFQHVSHRMLASVQLNAVSLGPLQQRLLRFYQPQHRCHLVRAETAFAPARFRSTTLAQLTSTLTLIDPETTLVLPPRADRSGSYDESLASLWETSDSTKCLSPIESLAQAQAMG